MTSDFVEICWSRNSKVRRDVVERAITIAAANKLTPTLKPWIQFVHGSDPAVYLYYIAQQLGMVPNVYCPSENKPCVQLERELYQKHLVPKRPQLEVFAGTSAASLFDFGALKPVIYAMHPADPAVQYHNSYRVDMLVANNTFVDPKWVSCELETWRMGIAAGTPFVIVLPENQTGVEDRTGELLLRLGVYHVLGLDLLRFDFGSLLRDNLGLKRLLSGEEMQAGFNSVNEHVLRNEARHSGWSYERYFIESFQEEEGFCWPNWYKYLMYALSCQSFIQERRLLSEQEHIKLAAMVADYVDGFPGVLPPLPIRYVFHLLRAV